MPKFVNTPFTFSVYDLMHRPGEQREKELEITLPERLGEGLISVPEGAQVHVDLRLESLGEGILATGDIEATAIGECGRCLEPVTQDLQVDFQELFAYSLDEAFDFEVQDDHVDLEPLIRDAVVLALPFQPVCRADCAGLDPETGSKLEEPLPETAQELDPRWAALRDVVASEDISGNATKKK